MMRGLEIHSKEAVVLPTMGSSGRVCLSFPHLIQAEDHLKNLFMLLKATIALAKWLSQLERRLVHQKACRFNFLSGHIPVS